jgi:transcriptional regulator with PAS, ATPase and Fis domain
LAATDNAKKKLLDKQDYFIDFINQMADLLISKLMEREKNILLKIMRKRLISIIDSIESGIIAVDERGNIIYYNSLVYEFINEVDIKNEDMSIYKLIGNPFIKKLIDNSESFKNKEIIFQKNNLSIYALISGKSIVIENENIGAILLFKKMSDVYSEINELSNSNVITSFEDIIGTSVEIQNVKKKAAIIAKSSSTVLILGESGTGKELFARAIHNCSNITDGPFIAINCAAIPDNLLESELFGYEDGAFTGAKKGGKIGKFQLAEGGTIFLDEIGDMTLHLQTKLLRVLQERSVEKLGSSESIPINVRVIAATNKDLEDMIKTREFREDLYYRLNVIPLTIPPLRQRKRDIKLLINYFLKVYNKILFKKIKGFSLDVEQILINYQWRGNVRELQNVIEYAVNMGAGDYIRLTDIPIRINNEIIEKEEINFQITSLDELIKKQIFQALDNYGTDVEGKTMAANALGISRATLYRKLKDYSFEDTTKA